MHIVISYDMLSNISLVISAAALVLSATVGVILGYHWRHFALSPLGTVGTLGLYAVGCVVLVALLFSLAPSLILTPTA
jgi:hypothetical protein